MVTVLANQPCWIDDIFLRYDDAIVEMLERVLF